MIKGIKTSVFIIIASSVFVSCQKYKQRINSNQMFVIGINASGVDSSGAAGWYRGYMSNLRYIVGSVPTDYQTSSTTNGTTIFTTPTSALTTTSQGATASDVQFLGLKDESSATATDVAGATISKGNHGSDVTVGHAGPF